MTEPGSCRHCGSLYPAVKLGGGQRSFCRVCHAPLNRGVRDPITFPLALSIAGLILLVIAMAFPMLVFEMQGRAHTSHLTSGITVFWTQGYGTLAVIVALTSVVAPFSNLFCMLYALAPLKLGIRLPGDKTAFRWVTLTRPWAWLLAAVLCYVPANIYPVMTVTFFGQTQSDTIISGVVALARAGE